MNKPKQRFEKTRGQNKGHKLARQTGGSNHKDNWERIDIVPHRASHILWGNATPTEQFDLLYHYNITTFREDFKEEFMKFMEIAQDLDFVYKEECYTTNFKNREGEQRFVCPGGYLGKLKAQNLLKK